MQAYISPSQQSSMICFKSYSVLIIILQMRSSKEDQPGAGVPPSVFASQSSQLSLII